jgi:hypothetical protein
MKHNRSVVAILLLGTILGTVIGCGDDVKRAAVKGKVTIDGTPLPDGVITFVPLDKANAQPGGSPIANGQYAISAANGLAAGEYQVQIRADRPTGKKEWDGMGDERLPASKKHYVDKMESYIPAQYNDRSTLQATVELGKVNVRDFDLHLPKK